MAKKIVMLVQNGESSRILYNALKNDFEIEKVIIENSVSKKEIIKRRIKKLGYLKVLGQIIFMLYTNLILKKISKSRILELMENSKLNNSDFNKEIQINVNSVNNIETVEALKTIQPDLVIVNGTRIISENLLKSIDAIFVNTHMGITPKYRGVHGGYWALVNRDYQNCGVTVHLVDKGIDTGGILYQDTIQINKDDTFCTYPYHQIAKAIPLMKQTINDFFNDRLKIKNRNDLESQLWTHPTIIEYIRNRILLGIK